MTPGLEDWVTTRRLAHLLALPQDTTANLFRRAGFPAHAMLRRDGYLLWHYPSVEAWRNAGRKPDLVERTSPIREEAAIPV